MDEFTLLEKTIAAALTEGDGCSIPSSMFWGALGFRSEETCNAAIVRHLTQTIEWLPLRWSYKDETVGLLEDAEIVVSIAGLKRFCSLRKDKGRSVLNLCLDCEAVHTVGRLVCLTDRGQALSELAAAYSELYRLRTDVVELRQELELANGARARMRSDKPKQEPKKETRPVRKMIKKTATDEQVARAMARAKILAEEADRELLGDFEVLRVGSKR